MKNKNSMSWGRGTFRMLERLGWRVAKGLGTPGVDPASQGLHPVPEGLSHSPPMTLHRQARDTLQHGTFEWTRPPQAAAPFKTRPTVPQPPINSLRRHLLLISSLQIKTLPFPSRRAAMKSRRL